MKWMMSAAVCAAAISVFGKQIPLQTPEPQPFDADLFRKDVQVYSGHLEFLYWTVEEGALDYALKMKTPAWSLTSPSYAQGNYQTAGYGFDPGFRIGISYYRAPKFWEAKWQYTRLTFRGHDHATAPTGSNEFLNGTWPQITTNPLTGADSKLHFNYNVFDMLVARVFNPNPHLRLRMIGGPTVAWMSQEWIVRYLDGFDNITRLNNQWSYAAGGLRFGTTIDWFWSGHTYVTAAGSTGVLVGSYHNQSKQTTSFQPDTGGNTAIPIRNAKLENIRASFTAQMCLGPSWQKSFKHARAEIFAGYEVAIWTNVQELYHSTSGTPSQTKETWINTSTLALHGISIRATGDF